jgi:hypothetical protein
MSAQESTTQELDDLRVLLTEVVDQLGPVAVTTALRDCDDTIVDFRYDYVNPAFCQTVGEPAEALLGNRLLELYPSHVELGLFDAYCDVVDTGEPFVNELPWFDERNVQAYLEVRVTRFRDGYLMSGQDITARRMAEQAQHMLDTTLHADAPRASPPATAATPAAPTGARLAVASDVDVWCRSTGRWAPGFRVEGHLGDGTVLVRRTTDRDALPESFPEASVRPTQRRASTGW